MQLLDDFNLSFDNLCALLYNIVGVNIDKVKVRQTLEDIMQTDGLTLQEIDGKYQFMTNAILGIREERNKIIPRDSEKAEVLQKQLIDIFTPAPSVNVYQSKTITAGVELTERNRPFIFRLWRLKKWIMSISNWGLIMNQIMLMFENRIQI